MFLFGFVGLIKTEMENMISNLLYSTDYKRINNLKLMHIMDIYTIGVVYIR